MVRLVLAVCISLFSAAALNAQSANDGGPPPLRIPNSIEQGKVDRPLREKYKAEFASRDAAERGELAKKLREAADAEKDSVAKFVYLREARDLAVDAGDFSYCFEVIDDMARSFPINGDEMKATALAGGVDRARLSPEELTERYLKITDEQLDRWNLDLAKKSAYLAWKLSMRNPELHRAAEQRDKVAKMRTHILIAAIQAKAKLEKSPDDPAANQIVGKHLCFNINHWDEGLPYLAKAESSALRTLAQQELAKPTDPSAMATLGDGWWNFADAKVGVPQAVTRQRAAYWYKKALPGLSGATKEEVEKRLAELMPH